MMDAKKPGSIVNVSSQGSLVALRDHLTYCASKAALDEVTRCMALELGPYQVSLFSHFITLRLYYHNIIFPLKRFGLTQLTPRLC